MSDDLNIQTRLRLIGFACAFAWADLELHAKEREHLLRLMERLRIDEPADRKKVIDWLRAPPPVDELDPQRIPRDARETFLRECEEIIRVDGVVHPEESSTLTLLRKILFGEAQGAS